MLPSALCLQLSPQVPAGVLNSRGAAISVPNCRVPVAWFPSFCRDLAVTPTRRFRILRRNSILSKIDSLCCCCFFFPLGLPLPPSGCTADRTLPPSPTTDAAIPPASAPPPPPPSSSASCCLSSQLAPACTFVIPHTFRSLSGAPSRRMQCAACTNSRRNNTSPALLIPNSGWLSPLSRCFLVSPRYGPTSRLCSNRSASSSVRMKVNAISVPTPCHLLQHLRLRVSFLDLLDLLVVHPDLFGHLFHAL